MASQALDESGLDRYYEQQFAQRERGLRAARAGMMRVLMEEGMDEAEARLAVGMVMGGHPAQPENSGRSLPPAIRLPGRDKAGARRIENALAGLVSRLEPHLPLSTYAENNEDGMEWRVVPWGGRSMVERALLDSPLSRPEAREDANGPDRGPESTERTRASETSRAAAKHLGQLPVRTSAHPARHPPSSATARGLRGHAKPGEGRAQEHAELQSRLHALADIRRLAHDLNPQAVFPPALEAEWVRAGAGGGRLRLRAQGPPRAKAFYEQLAGDFAGLLQKRAGQQAEIRMEWEAPDRLAVEAGLPETKARK
ncbi:Uncharacterised protein [uncultured archaeon]|nr:Uncharacterised protein [uncultured archaeon]